MTKEEKKVLTEKVKELQLNYKNLTLEQKTELFILESTLRETTKKGRRK